MYGNNYGLGCLRKTKNQLNSLMVEHDVFERKINVVCDENNVR